MSNRSILFIVIAIITLSISSGSRLAAAEKKLIEYGWDCPDTAYFKANIEQMEKSPFSGVVILVRSQTGEPSLGGTDDVLGWKVFGKNRFNEAQIQHAIDDLKSTPRKRFTDNFIQVISNPGDVDWFDDEGWESILHNVRLMARVAKQGGCVGIMFDAEEYGHLLWTHSGDAEGKTTGPELARYQVQLRNRGQDFIRAINAEFPDAKLLCLFGPSIALHYRRHDKASYNLLPAFMEGMCIAATDQTQIIDGFEQSYSLHRSEQFTEGRKTMAIDSREQFVDKAAFDRSMRFGFGLWMDNLSGTRTPQGWFPDEPSKNFFPIDEWKMAVSNALSASDEYVWIYTERATWWPNGPGKAYVEATEQAVSDLAARAVAP